ncbi:PREDICTED: ribonuclease 3-like protein 2 [Tarenaya hassleriana]|uniref:ribonuclease 3-like protein 2 n=1 Tax=Tarenaya hassleriana TaxID=28532 RepID=UPI00053C71C9|nr:PREDICTED: ribonuclease 3-like protein 2 [Tarenaya hassleriana]
MDRLLSPSVPVVPPSPDMVDSVRSVESILNHRFTDKRLLEQALTHSSCMDSPSYERLEFVGDISLGLAFTNYLYLAYPNLDQGQLSELRSVNVSTEKLARVAVKHGLYRFLRRVNVPSMDEKVKEFSDSIAEEDETCPVSYGGSVKAPKVLADLVESVAAAVYIDVNFDLQRLWVIFRGLLEPTATLEDLQRHPHPVTKLFNLCQKHGKRVEIKYLENDTGSIAGVYLDGECIASEFAEQNEISKLNAAKAALSRLSEFLTVDTEIIDDGLEIECAKKKLHERCIKKKWAKPIYSVEREEGRSHEKKFVCSVKIPTQEGVLYIEGDERCRIRDAENSAASFMIQSLKLRNDLL